MLTDAKTQRPKPGDRSASDGAVPGHYLMAATSPSLSKWILRFVSPETRKRDDIGLDAYSAVPVAAARRKAAEAKRTIASGDDPIERRWRNAAAEASTEGVPTFTAASRAIHATLELGFRKHGAQWITTLETYAFRSIGVKRVDTLSAGHFVEVLGSLCLPKLRTASLVRHAFIG